MEIVAAGATDIGHQRSANEDAYGCGDTVFVVADGLGGHAAGDVASRLAVEQVCALDPIPQGNGAAPALERAVREANEAVFDAAARDPGRSGMATTVTAAAVDDGRVILAHVGDSRAYLLRPITGGVDAARGPVAGLSQLTVDHTLAEQAVAAGELTREQAAVHRSQHTLTRAVGTDPEVTVDVLDPVTLVAGDRLLLCSDGLTGPVTDERIAELLTDHDDPDEAAGALVRAALDVGAPDNITVVVLRVDA